MRFRWLAALAAAILTGGTAAAQPAEPTVEIRLRSVNDLFDKAQYAAGLAGQEEIVKQVRFIVKGLTTEGKGVEGIDPARPFGLYATLATDAVNSPFTVMVPIADQDRFLQMLKDRLEITPEKVDGGAFKVALPDGAKNPVLNALFLRFADGYMYVARSAKDLDPKGLIAPKTYFAKDDGAVASILVRFDRIPAEVKTFVIGQVELGIAEQRKKNGANENAAEKAFLDWFGDGLSGGIKSLFEDSKEFAARLVIDEKTDDLLLDVTLTPKTGTAMAKYIASLAGKPSVPAGIVGGRGKIAGGSAKIAMPDEMKKRFAGMVDDLIAEAVKKAGANEKEFAEKVLKTLAPTAKAAELDFAAALHGPDAKGRYTVVAAAAVKDGKEIEKLVKDFAPLVGGAAEFTFDIEKVGDFALHKVVLAEVPPEVEKLFGTSTIWLATSENHLAVSIEEDGTAIRAGLKAKPAPVPVLSVDVSFAKLLPLMKPDLKPDELKAIMKDTFGDGGPAGKDAITVTVTGRTTLTAKATIKGKVVQLGITSEVFKKN